MHDSKLIFYIFICACITESFIRAITANKTTTFTTTEELPATTERTVGGNNCTTNSTPGGSSPKQDRNFCKTKEAPYVVSIKATYGMVHVCGGSLVDALHVLTAAHCYVEEYVYYVVSGQSNFVEFDADEDIQMAFVVKVIVHPNYNPKAYLNDIAVFRLMYPFLETENTKYVGLPPPKSSSPCPTLNISGWGQIRKIDRVFTLQLQCLELSIYSKDECYKTYSRKEYDLSSSICTSNQAERQSVCFGDSGGPLMCGETQRALASWGAHCVGDRYPTVHTDVSQFVGFILNTVMTDGACCRDAHTTIIVVLYIIIRLILNT